MYFNKIALQFEMDEYSKALKYLPIPTYRKEITHSKHSGYVIIIFEIIHPVTSPKQLLWIANIKEYMKKGIKAKFDFIEIENIKYLEGSNKKYTMEELGSCFQEIYIKYPNIMYASYKKDIYKKLCWYSTRLHHRKILSLEMVMYAAIKMNKVLNIEEQYSRRELFKKAKASYEFILDNKDDLPQKLSKEELKKAHQKGGNIRAKQLINKKEQNIKRITKAIESELYTKYNGKQNIYQISLSLNLSRTTVHRLIKSMI